MSDKETGSLWVITGIGSEAAPGRVERGIGGGLRQGLVKSMETGELKRGMEQFLGQLEEMLAAGRSAVGEFEIAEITVSAQVTAEGKVCLLGSGVELGMQGGLQFLLKRRSP